MKRILVLQPDGTERELSAAPTLREMRAIVGGTVDHVRVLDRLEPGPAGLAGVYTSMFVNDTGLSDGLPRNAKATEIYQRNIRAQFADHAQPFRAAREEMLARYATMGATFIDATPPDVAAAGYHDDPWIAGPAIFFEGWTCEEVDAAFEQRATA